MIHIRVYACTYACIDMYNVHIQLHEDHAPLPLQGHTVRSMNCGNLHKRAERIGAYILEKLRCNSGDHVALMFPCGTELVAAFFGCLYVGELTQGRIVEWLADMRDTCTLYTCRQMMKA